MPFLPAALILNQTLLIPSHHFKRMFFSYSLGVFFLRARFFVQRRQQWISATWNLTTCRSGVIQGLPLTMPYANASKESQRALSIKCWLTSGKGKTPTSSAIKISGRKRCRGFNAGDCFPWESPFHLADSILYENIMVHIGMCTRNNAVIFVVWVNENIMQGNSKDEKWPLGS